MITCPKCGKNDIQAFVESTDEYKITADDGETLMLEFVKPTDNPCEYTFVCRNCHEVLDEPDRSFECT